MSKAPTAKPAKGPTGPLTGKAYLEIVRKSKAKLKKMSGDTDSDGDTAANDTDMDGM